MSASRCAALAWLLSVSAGSALAEEPQWLTEARAREGRDIGMHELASTDGYLSAKVAGKVLEKVEEDEGTYAVTLDIGSQVPVNCEVIVDGFDPASMLRATADLTFERLEPLQGKIEQRAVERTDAGVFGSSPYLEVAWIYRADDGKAPRLGGLKQAVVMKEGRGLYCAHVDLGYVQSFRGAVKSLAETLRFPAGGTEPYFTEIHTASLRGAKIGVMVATLERDGEGDSKLVVVTSLLVLTTPNTLRAQDANHVQWIRPDGSLINAVHAVNTNGELEAHVSLQAGEEGGWDVKGEFKGKPINAQIESEESPATWVELANERRQMMAAGDAVGSTSEAPQWSLADPTRFVDTHTTIVAVGDPGHFLAHETLGDLAAQHVLERSTGTSVKTTIEIGPMTIEMERVHREGSF